MAVHVHHVSIACSNTSSIIAIECIHVVPGAYLAPRCMLLVQCIAQRVVSVILCALLQLVDFISVLAAAVIFGNIFSILVWKVGSCPQASHLWSELIVLQYIVL